MLAVHAGFAVAVSLRAAAQRSGPRLCILHAARTLASDGAADVLRSTPAQPACRTPHGGPRVPDLGGPGFYRV